MNHNEGWPLFESLIQKLFRRAETQKLRHALRYIDTHDPQDLQSAQRARGAELAMEALSRELRQVLAPPTPANQARIEFPGQPAESAARPHDDHCSQMVYPTETIPGETWERRPCRRRKVITVQGRPYCRLHGIAEQKRLPNPGVDVSMEDALPAHRPPQSVLPEQPVHRPAWLRRVK